MFLGHLDAAVTERHRDLIDGNTGQQQFYPRTCRGTCEGDNACAWRRDF